MSNTSTVLSKLMKNISTIYQRIQESRPENSVAVFDLDSTLYGVLNRTRQIMYDLEKDPQLQKLFPNDVSRMSEFTTLDSDWGITEGMNRLGYPAQHPFHKAAKRFWQEHFFSSPYLAYDQPYPGAVDFVNRLLGLGVQILYLTGRDEVNMLNGTLKSLKHHNFPLAETQHLHMKPTKGHSLDEVFKSVRLAQIKTPDKKFWFFENEPVILNRVEKDHPEIELIFIDTVHSGRASSPTHLPSIRGDYRF